MHNRLLHLLAPLLVCGLAVPGRAGIVMLAPAADNTLYESPTGALSNGKGWHCFAGVTGIPLKRRALSRFDIAAHVPAGATVRAVELRLHLSKTQTTVPAPTTLHRVTAAWGEGSSDAPEEEGIGQFSAPGDATWIHTFHPGATWSQPGGDFSPVASATLALEGTGFWTWTSTPALVADVQSWLDSPADDHGWIVVGTEGRDVSAKRFDTREHPDPARRPRLRIEYTLPGECGPAIAPQQTVRVGTPPNPNAFLPGSSGTPALGTLWDPRVDHASFVPTALLDIIAIAAASTQLPTGAGTLLVAPAPPPLLFTRPAGQPFAIHVPADCALAGAELYAQAAALEPSGAFAFANALDLIVGAP